MNLILLLLFAIVPLSLSAETVPPSGMFWNRGRSYRPFKYATENGIAIDNHSHSTIIDCCQLQQPMPDFSLTFRASNLNSNPQHRYHYTMPDGKKATVANPAWGFFIRSNEGKQLWVTVSPEEIPDRVSSSAALRIAISTGGNKEPVFTIATADGIDTFDGINTWRLTSSDNRVILSAGNREMSEIATIEGGYGCSSFGFAASPGASVSISDISLAAVSPLSGMKAGKWEDADRLRMRFADSDDEFEGYWTVFDRTLEESLLRMGGDYKLAIVKDGSRYEIIYIDGAKTNHGKWKKGMTKGYLYPQPFPGIFNVEWIDAEGKTLSNGIKAQTGEGGTLLLQFPYHSSSLRLRKLPASYSSGRP